MDPMAIDNILGLFVLVPIISGRAVSADQQIANLTLFYRVAAFIGNQCFIAWHELTRASRLYLAYTVADKDMQDLGGQGLTSRDTNAHGGEIEAFLYIGQGEHTSVERGNTEKDGRAILLNHFEHVLRQWPLRVMYCARPHCEGEVEVIAETIGE